MPHERRRLCAGAQMLSHRTHDRVVIVSQAHAIRLEAQVRTRLLVGTQRILSVHTASFLDAVDDVGRCRDHEPHPTSGLSSCLDLTKSSCEICLLGLREAPKPERIRVFACAGSRRAAGRGGGRRGADALAAASVAASVGAITAESDGLGPAWAAGRPAWGTVRAPARARRSYAGGTLHREAAGELRAAPPPRCVETEAHCLMRLLL
mmetsp:Transcript_111037/g.313140  ORF Transcript_111037/g.313140 Transcript_111037/m.313140 type:complete len:207 (-) Transcript_111037:488-1108(-)